MYEYSEAGPFRRLVRRTAGTRLMATIYKGIQEPVDRLVYRATNGRATASSWAANLPVVLLTTTGAKSGQRRTHPVLAVPDGEALVVIASNYGRPHNPAWYHNLKAHPAASVTVRGETQDVEARELEGAERDRYYERGIEMYPPFVHYRRWAGDRLIPVLRLDRA
jgi:deazaflavin-dependent oxidoreductase (nitroreductase family)